MSAPLLIKVAIPSPLRRSFDYLLPASRAFTGLAPGIRVRVPFGRRELIGIILSITPGGSSEVPADKLKEIIEIIDTEAILDTATLALYLWASSYYQFPIGQALQTSLPKYIREGRPLESGLEVRWRLSETGKISNPESLKRAKQQAKLFDLLKHYQHLSAAEASVLLDTSASNSLKALAEKEIIERFYENPLEHAQDEQEQFLYNKDQPLTLNQEQSTALQTLTGKLNQFHCSLLEGITGSGKTEVYLQLIAKVLKNNQQVLVLVPEISLTPQTIKRFEDRFNRTIVSLHSGLNNTQRFKAWLKARNGSASIIIGTRSAIFTPMKNLGLIIIDEEHDSSYKQQDGFRYSARDLAIYRARELNIPILLGSATPSLESLHNALSARYDLLHLSQRPGAALPPQFKFIDLKGQTMQEGFSLALLESIKVHLNNHKQVLIFINRRGFAPLLQCHDCGWAATCPRCETGYTLHQNPPGLRCHHCESQVRLMSTCPECNSTELSAIGLGTERSEKVLSQHFADTPILRVDRDTTTNKGAMGKIIDTINSNEPCILIGTQMLAKGHHFPAVTLVAILDADSGLFSADFRGQEQMGQLLTQVAGRAGRGEHPGEVLIQTYHSTHPTLNTLINDGYGVFARKILAERHTANLPPFSHLILFKAEASQRNRPEAFLHLAKEFSDIYKSSKVSILGPMPAPMEKRAGRFRAQMLLQSKTRTDLHLLARKLINALEQHPDSRKVRWSVDIDPIDFT